MEAAEGRRLNLFEEAEGRLPLCGGLPKVIQIFQIHEVPLLKDI